MTLQDGKIVLAGMATEMDEGGACSWFALARLDAEGYLDATFNGTCVVLTTSIIGEARGVTIDALGMIVAAGWCTIDEQRRLDPAQLRRELQREWEQRAAQVRAAVADDPTLSSERTRAASAMASALAQRGCVVRYRDDGCLDSDFGLDGVMLVGGHNDTVSAITGDAEGQLLLAGTRRTRQQLHTDFTLARLQNVSRRTSRHNRGTD